MAAKLKYQYGISNMRIAFYAADSAPGALKFETPIQIPGVVNIEMENSGSENTFYADNVAYVVQFSDSGYSGSIEVAAIPDDVLIKMFGYIKTAIGGLLEVQGGANAPFALMGQVEGRDMNGAAAPRRFVYYNCSGSKPVAAHGTQEDTVTPQTQSMNISATAVQVQPNFMASKYSLMLDPSLEGNQNAYDAFFTAVPIPTVAELQAAQAAAQAAQAAAQAAQAMPTSGGSTKAS